MKIAFDARFIEQESTGVGNCAHGLLGRLREVGPHHEWQVLHSSIPFTAHPLSDAWMHGYLPWKLWRGNSDVYFSPAFYVPQFSGGARIVTMIHDLAVFRYPQSFPMRFTLYFREIIRHAVRRSDHVVVNSAFTKSELLEFFPWLPQDRVTIIPLGPASWTSELVTGHLAPGRPAIEGPFLLHVGTLEPRKNLLRLIHTFRRWSRRNPEWKLVLAGKGGWYGDQIRTLSQDDRDRILFTGYVDEQALLQLYRTASGLIVPSFYEGFGIPILEGILANVPLIVSRIPPFLEIAGDHLTTFSPENEEEIEARIEDVRDRPQSLLLPESERQRILSSYTWLHSATLLQSVFESLR